MVDRPQLPPNLPHPDWLDEEYGVALYRGDCLEVMPRLPDRSIAAIFTDPPYGHNNQSGDLQSSRVGIKGARKAAPISIANDGQDEMRSVVSGALEAASAKLTPDCCCCCCCCGGGPSPTFAWFANALDSAPYKFFHAVVWDKSERGHGLGWRFRRDYEFLMFAHLRSGRLSWNEEMGALPNILRFRPPANVDHPTTKPVDMFEQIINYSTPRDSVVLDPFMGSGTTGVACVQLGRAFIGIELDPKYFDIAVRRIREAIIEKQNGPLFATHEPPKQTNLFEEASK